MKSFDSESGGALKSREKDMVQGQSHDLFQARPAVATRPRRAKPAPELAAARVLCRQLPRKRVSAEKKRIIHLICLNLVAILKRRSQEA